jgi:putative membrane protein
MLTLVGHSESRASEILSHSHPPSLTMVATLVGNLLSGVVGALHLFIFHLESLTWYRGAAKGFGVKPEDYAVTATLAANQGFYNLVLAVGCFYSLYTGDLSTKLFFQAAIFACGVIGFLTTGSAKILRAQCVPTALSLLALLYGASGSKDGLSTLTVGALVLALAGAVAISFFVKARLAQDGAFHAKKLAGGK